jgi:hypothetical protein
VPLISKLVWPVFLVLLLLVFREEARAVYTVILERIRC